MNPTALLLATFILSIVGLFAFIWSLRKGLFEAESSGARTIFSTGEIGHPEEPSVGPAQQSAWMKYRGPIWTPTKPKPPQLSWLPARRPTDPVPCPPLCSLAVRLCG